MYLKFETYDSEVFDCVGAKVPPAEYNAQLRKAFALALVHVGHMTYLRCAMAAESFLAPSKKVLVQRPS